MGQRIMRDDFVPPLPEANPLPQAVSDRKWAITVAYINDPSATLRSVGRDFDISAEWTRQNVQTVALRLWRCRSNLVRRDDLDG